MWRPNLRLSDRLRALGAALAHWLAWLNGDDAYARHVDHLREQHPDSTPPTRAAFYKSEVERRWNGVRRCC